MSRHGGGARRRVGGVRTRGWGLPARRAMQRRAAPAAAPRRHRPRPRPPSGGSTAPPRPAAMATAPASPRGIPRPALPASRRPLRAVGRQAMPGRGGARRGRGLHGGEGGLPVAGPEMKKRDEVRKTPFRLQTEIPEGKQKVPTCYQASTGYSQQLPAAEGTCRGI